jgi:nitrous oxidase accessory protein
VKHAAPTALLALLAFGCADAGGSLPPREAPPAPARPVACAGAAAGADVQALLDSAPEGTAVCLDAGVHAGPLRVRRAVTLWGRPDAVVRSTGDGTTIRVEAAGARLSGFTVDGSGARYDLLDAAVHVGADDVVVEGLTIERATFGILVERAKRAAVRGNLVRGDPAQTLGLRGDGIRLWETSDSVVEDNVVSDSRDLVVWYSSRNLLRRNLVTGSRYAAHLMYSHGCTVEDNRAVGNVVGVFVMYVRGGTIRGNLLAGASGAAGMGIGLKDSGDLTVTGNRVIDDTVGLFIDNSPVQAGDDNRIADNLFRGCGRAVVFHGGAGRNRFTGNALVDNRVQVENEGDGAGATWTGNWFDDYAGYDLDGDGTGDIPYEVRSLRGDVVTRHPELRFFDGAPALALAEAVGRLVPLARPTLVARDDAPLTCAPRFGGRRAR